TLFDQPFSERALLHGRRKGWHLEFDGHALVSLREGSQAQSQCGERGQVRAEPLAPTCAYLRFNAAEKRMGEAKAKRTYLVVVDDSAEARVALRFAARRAAKTKGRVEVLGIVEPQDFVQFGGVQQAIAEEQQLRIQGVVSAAIGELLD